MTKIRSKSQMLSHVLKSKQIQQDVEMPREVLSLPPPLPPPSGPQHGGGLPTNHHHAQHAASAVPPPNNVVFAPGPVFAADNNVIMDDILLMGGGDTCDRYDEHGVKIDYQYNSNGEDDVVLKHTFR